MAEARRGGEQTAPRTLGSKAPGRPQGHSILETSRGDQKSHWVTAGRPGQNAGFSSVLRVKAISRRQLVRRGLMGSSVRAGPRSTQPALLLT